MASPINLQLRQDLNEEESGAWLQTKEHRIYLFFFVYLFGGGCFDLFCFKTGSHCTPMTSLKLAI